MPNSSIPDTPVAVSEMEIETRDCRYGRMSFFSFDAPIGEALRLYGQWAQHEIAFLARFISPGATVVDAGANIGTHTLAFAALVGPRGKVCALEAQPQVYALLARNVSQNSLDNVMPVPAAVGAQAAVVSVPLITGNERRNVGAFSLVSGSGETDLAAEHAEVPVVALDSLGLDDVAVLKLDVEGMEHDVLLGAAATLRRSRPLVFSECNRLEAGWDLVRLLRAADYQAYYCRFPAFDPQNLCGNAENFFGVAEESSLLLVPVERSDWIALAEQLVTPVPALEDLARALIETPRYGDATDYERKPGELWRVIARLERERDVAETQLQTQRHENGHLATVAGVERRLHEAVLRALGQAGTGRAADPPPRCQSIYDVLIPIFNAHDHVKRCVESVLRHTDPRHPVVLLDDASTDPRLLPLLQSFARLDGRVRVVSAASNAGFVGNVNRGFALSRNEVVILNSDTQVTPGWLERLDRCRSSHAAIGIVSPLSNNATILSVPAFNAPNELPAGVSVDDFAGLVARASPRAYPRLPTAVGFCMLITRETLDRIGVFDTAFGLGYGEESDYCMRAWRAGIETACCDDAYVHHYGEASFSSVTQIGERRRRNAELLAQRWPRYHPAVQTFCHINPLRQLQERLLTLLVRRPEESRPHILHVLHSFDVPGGTELHTRRIIDGLADRYRATAIYPQELAQDWADLSWQTPAEHLRTVGLRRANATAADYFLGIPGDVGNRLVEENFARFVAGGDYDIVHFQHLANWDTLRLPLIAKGLGKRVVLTLHDYYLLCPEYNLILPELRRCGKARADEDDAECLRCLGVKRERGASAAPRLLHEYLSERALNARRALEVADAVIAPSEFVRQQFTRAFGAEVGAKIRVVPHGIELSTPSLRPPAHSLLRVGFLGNLTERKGAHVLLDAAAALRGMPVRFEVFGGFPERIQPLALNAGVVLHGNYSVEELPVLLARVDLVVIPSIWDETYCLTLSEAQALGVPVMAAAAGALAERVIDGETGFLVPPGDPKALARRLMELAVDRSPLERVGAALSRARHKSLRENAEDYARLYAELAAGGELIQALLGTRAATDAKGAAAVKRRVADAFQMWAQRQALQEVDLRQIEMDWPAAAPIPIIHLLMRLEDGEQAHLADTIDTLAAQRYGHWRLSVVADFPPPDAMFADLEILQWRQVATAAEALEAARGLVQAVPADWVGFIAPGDRLSPEALLVIAAAIIRHPGWQFVYADEDQQLPDDTRASARLKPDANLELLRSQPYVGCACLVSRPACLAAGGFGHVGDPGHYELALRVIEQHGPAAIGHVARVLYHRLAENAERFDPQIWSDTAARILRGHLQRAGVSASVSPGTLAGTHWIAYRPAGEPDVTIVVTASNAARLQACLAPLLDQTAWRQVQVLVWWQGQTPPALPADARLRLIQDGAEIAASPGPFVCFLSEDLVVVQPTWLERLLALAQQPGVGIVAPRQLRPDQTLRGIGEVLGLGPEGIVAPLQSGLPLSAPGPLGRAQVAQDLSVVPGEGMLLRKGLWAEILGNRSPLEDLAHLELCLRARERGLRVVWTPYATLLHRGADAHKPSDRRVTDAMRERWLPQLAHDAAYNRNLSLADPQGRIDDEFDVRWHELGDGAVRVLGLGFGSHGSWLYRGVQPLSALDRVGRACTKVGPNHPDRVRVPNVTELERLSPHCLLLHNTVHDAHIAALQQYRRFHRERLLIFGQDDLMSALPAKNPFSRTVYRDIKKRLRLCLSLCDRLVVTTNPLAEAYTGMIADIRVVPNYLERDRWTSLTSRRRQGARARVGWAGALQHAGDLEFLHEVVRETADEVDWVFLGMCPEAIRPYVAEFYAPVEYEEYPQRLASMDLDLALAPLEHHPFNQAKSNLRLLEYGACGFPVIASDNEPYRGAPVTRVANKPKSWVNAIREHVHDLDAAATDGDALRRWVLAGWLLEDHLDEWMAALGVEDAALTRRTAASGQ